MAATRIIFPAGRLVAGSVEKMFGNTEADGKTPKLGKDGKQTMSVSFGVAIPKTQADWRNEVWGAQMFAVGKAAQPVLHQTPTFAWKIVDGDSNVPNKNGKIPNQQVGHAGHWVLWFKQGWAPKIVNADGSVDLPAGSIVPGYYVQVAADVASNGAQPPNTPGLFLNPIAVALVGVGDKIITEVDTKSLGFGQAPLPPGAQPVPKAFDMGGGHPPAAPAAGMAPPPATPAAAPATSVTAAAVPVVPNTAFMTPPPAPVMTAKAGGATYEQFKANNWTDEMMRKEGYLV